MAMTTRQHGQYRSNRGFIWLITLWVLIPLVMLVQISLSRSAHEIRLTQRSVDRLQAFHRAEGVLDDTLYRLAQNLTPSCADPPPFGGSLASGTNTSSCVVADVSGNKQITVDGYWPNFASGNFSARRRLVVNAKRTPPANPIPYAAFGATRVGLDSSVLVDSYDSSLGGYSPNTNPTAPVRTNGTSGGPNEAITLAAGATLYGNATVGPGGSAINSIAVATGPPLAHIYGAQNGDPNCTANGQCVATSSWTPPTVSLPAGSYGGTGTQPVCSSNAASPQRYCVAPSGSCPGAPAGTVPFLYDVLSTGSNCYMEFYGDDGHVYLKTFASSSGSRLTFNGNNMALTTTSTGTSAFDTGSNLTITGLNGLTITANSNVIIRTGSLMDGGSRNRITLKVVGARTVNTGAITFRGIIIAPLGDVLFGGDAVMFGGIIADFADIRPGSLVHYDLSLTGNSTGPYDIVSWQETD